MGIRTLVLVAAVVSPAAAFADDLHVPGDFRRFQEALDAAVPGDRILLEGGVHRGPFVVLTDDLVIEGIGATLVQKASASRSSSPERDAALSVHGDRVTIRTLRIRRGGIRVQGEGALIDRCIVEQAGNRKHLVHGLEVLGDDACIQFCVLEGGRGRFQGLRVDGARADVWRNGISGVREGRGVEVVGDQARISQNTLSDIQAREAIVVRGEIGTIDGNEVGVADGTGGTLLVEGDGGVISRNRVGDGSTGSPSILVEGSGGTVADNVVTAGAGTGIIVRGDGTAVEGNEVSGWFSSEATFGGHGIVVRGSDNVLHGNSSWGAPADGIRVVGGYGNVIDGCRMSRSGACGLLNLTTGTSVTGSGFWSSAMDVVNAGSFSRFAGNSFDSGSANPSTFTGSTGPEADFGIEVDPRGFRGGGTE